MRHESELRIEQRNILFQQQKELLQMAIRALSPAAAIGNVVVIPPTPPLPAAVHTATAAAQAIAHIEPQIDQQIESSDDNGDNNDDHEQQFETEYLNLLADSNESDSEASSLVENDDPVHDADYIPDE